MYQEPWKNYFFPTKDQPLSDKFTLWRKFSQNLSPEAKLRLEWMIFYETVGQRNAAKTAAHFGISRKTLHKWLKRFQDSQQKVESLKSQSRAPHHIREWEVNPLQEKRVVGLRKKHLKYGKRKLKVLYQKKYQPEISCWKIERVIRKRHLYPEIREDINKG